MTKIQGWGVLGFIISTLAFAGFEIGNGRKIVHNLEGGYELKIPNHFEVGQAGKFTEIVAPLSFGTPRSRVQLNVVHEKAGALTEEEKAAWEAVNVGNLVGHRKVTVLPTRLHQEETRIITRPGEILIINVEGTPSGLPDGIFEAATRAVETLKIIEKP